MSQTIDNRIVEMQFENKQFESGVQESLSTLDKLKNALKFDDASKNLQDFSKNINRNIDLSGVTKSIDGLSDKFSASGVAGMEVIRKLTDFAIDAGKKIASALDAPFKQIREGGWKRAMNIEDAKFQLKGVGMAWESVADDINFAVADTAYGLDAAAKACSQLAASGIQAGEGMKAALRGISGVAAMGNTEYENITDIFTKAAGNGKVMAQELNRVSQYGINARAEVVKFFNDINSGAEKLQKYQEESGITIPETVKKNVKALTKGTQMAEADLADFVKKGKLDFETFSYAMDYAFGKHAKDANETFMGALRNIKAALSKIGAEFSTPIIKGAIPIFNEVRVFLNDLRKHMGPIFEVFSKITNLLSGKLTNALHNFRVAFLDFGAIDHIGNAIKNVFTSVIKIFVAVKNAFETVFPPAHNFARSVESMAEGVENLSKHLLMSDSAMITFRNVMIVVFNIMKALGTVIKSILPILGKIVTIVAKIAAVMVGLIGYIIQLVSNLDITKRLLSDVQKAGGLVTYAIDKLKSAFAYLRDTLSDTTTVTGRFFAKLKEVATVAAAIAASGLYMGFMKIKEVLSYFDAHDPLGSLINGVKTLVEKLNELPVIKNVISGIETVFGAVSKTLKTLVEMVVTFVKELNSGKTILEAFGSSLSIIIEAASSLFSTLIEKVSSFFSLFKGEKVIEETVEMPIYGANTAMVGFVKTLSATETEVTKTTSSFDKAKSSVSGFASTILTKIRNIEASKVILAAYAGVLLLIAYNANQLLVALGGLTRKLSGGLFNVFRSQTTKVDKFKIAMSSITVSIIALTASIYALTTIPTDKLDKVTNSLLKLIGLVGGLSLLSTVLTTLAARFNSVQGFAGFSLNMASLSAGVLAMIYALKLLESVNLNDIWTRVAILGTIAAGLMTVSVLMAKLAPQLTAGSLFMIAFSGSVLILVKALDNLSKVDLKAIQDNWEGLAIVIASFGAFAALAGTVGISSTASLIAFLLGMRVLLANFEAIREKLIEYKFGDILVSFFSKLRDGIKAALGYAKGIYDSLSEFDKIMLAVYAAITSGGLFLVLIGLSKASKYVKKAAVSATIFAAAIAGLMYATYKIAEACKTMTPDQITSAQRILLSVGGLLLATIAIVAILGGEGTSELTNTTGWFGKKKIGKSVVTKTKSNMLKQARKMLLDMAVLLASVALFVNVVGKLNDTELARAEGLLRKVMAVFVGLEIAVTMITAFSRNTSGMASAVTVFIGTIALIGTLLGSFVILMNYFKDYTFDKDGVTRLVVVLGILTGVVVSILTFLKRIKGIAGEGKGENYKTILAFGAMIGVLGYVITELMTVIKNKDDLIRAGEIAAGLIGFLAIMATMVLIMESVTKKILRTTRQQAAFTKAIIALGVMVAAVAALALTFYALKNVDSGRMALQATIITLTLAALSTIVMAIQHFAKSKYTSITKKTSDDLKTTTKMLIGFFVAFEALAITFAGLRNVDSGRMALQATIITTTLAALSAIVLAIQHFSKNKYTSLTPTSSNNINKTLLMLGAFFVAFEALAITFAAMRNVDAGRMAGQAATIVLALTGITAIALGVTTFVKKVKPTWSDLSKSAVMITGMIAIFAALSLIFKYIISDIPDPTGMLAKSQIIMLALGELVGLMALCGVIGKMGLKNLGLGEVGLLGMIVLLGLLTEIFVTINNLQTTGIMAKSQTIILVMTELIALIALMGVLVNYAGGVMITGGLAELALWPMISLFGMLADIFLIINGMRTEGIMAKSQTIILVMTELIALIALMGGLVYAAGVIAIGGLAELALWPMINLFGLLTDVFLKIDGMKTEGIMAKSQTIILVMTELATLIALMGVIIPFIALGGLGELALWPMIVLFGQLTEVFLLIDGMKTEGLLAKSQTIILVLTELVGLSVLSILSTIALVGVWGLDLMVDVFAKLTSVFTVIDKLHLEGLREKAHTVVLILLELEGLSVLSILSAIALIGGPGLDTMVDIFGKLSMIFLIIDQMHLEGMREKADIIVDTIMKLEGLSALGGLIGGTLGGGLLLLAQGIQAFGVACNSVGNGLNVFAASVERLVATGPAVTAWFTSVAVGVTTLSTSVMTSITGLSKSVVQAVNTLVTGVVSALISGGSMIFAAAATMGGKLLDGFNSKVKPKTWGADLVKTFASGIMGNLSPIINAVTAVANIIHRYLHFTSPDEGPASDFDTYAPDMMNTFGNGITSNMDLVSNPISNVATLIKNGFSGIDLSSIGSSIMATLTNGVISGEGPLFDQLNSIMNAFGMVSNRIAEFSKTWSSHSAQLASTMDNYYSTLKSNATAADNEVRRLEGGLARLKTNARHTSEGMGAMNAKLEAAKEKSAEAHKALTEFETGVVDTGKAAEEAAEKVTGFGDAGKGTKDKLKETKDEIADFYDSIKSAINLFEEFNKETELTSDKLLENMRSQIQGVSEWANQIQQLAFMGIDQGLLQQLAEMGPQGYEYTNAFIHMTADQLAEANNLYHQSLMLPSKVTSQVYGSYTVAGRNAASGFLQGLQQEDIKTAAVGFAHQVVDQMNVALDIQSGKSMVTYKDGVAVVNGVKTGISAGNMGTAIDLLIKNDIKAKFDEGIMNSTYMYNVGTNITLGLARGVENEKATSALYGAVIRVCEKAIKTAEETTEVASPSKVFTRIGRFLTLGLAKGITDETQSAVHAMDKTAEGVINTMRNTLNKANEALIDGVDDPVITPILDLSNIENGSREINDLLSRNSAYSAGRSFGNLQNEQWNSQSALLNATMDNSDIVSAVDSLKDDIISLKDAMTNIRMVLDTGTMVGAMTPMIDQQLGMRQVYAGRGI